MRELLHLAGLAKRAGRLAMGEDSVEEAVKNHKARLILLAEDASEGTARRVRNRAGDRAPVLGIPVSRAELGGALGRESCAACAFTDLGLAAKSAAVAAQGHPEYAAVAEELQRRQEKALRRKKEKPRKK